MAETLVTSAKSRRPAWRRSPLTVAGLVLIAVLALIAASAPLIAPANPLKQVLSTRLKPPSADSLDLSPAMWAAGWTRA